MILSLLLPLIFASTSGAAAPICSNLSAATCVEGVRDDGTGVSQVVDSNAFIIQEFERMRPSIQSNFDDMLRSPAGEQLKPLLKKACLLDRMVECRQLQNPICHREMVNCLDQIYQVTELDPEHRFVADNEAEYLSAEHALQIVQSEPYRKAAEKITKENGFQVSNELKNKVAFDVFPNVQRALLQKIRELPIDNSTMNKMIRKVSSIKFEGVQCGLDTDYSTGLGQSLAPNAFFNHDRNTFNICPAFLRHTTSEFDLAVVISHELVHAIDPCRLGEGNMTVVPMDRGSPDSVIDNQYLRPNFLSCLRSPSSIGAKSFRKLQPPIAGSSELSVESLLRLCGEGEDGDQINESVADWFAAESLANYLTARNQRVKPQLTQQQMQTGMSNLLRNFCGEEFNSSTNLDVHPTTSQRLNSIFLVQPKLRQMMGCPLDLPGKRYCDIARPESLTGVSTPQTPTQIAPARERQVEQ